MWRVGLVRSYCIVKSLVTVSPVCTVDIFFKPSKPTLGERPFFSRKWTPIIRYYDYIFFFKD